MGCGIHLDSGASTSLGGDPSLYLSVTFGNLEVLLTT
jgi:hypothetical protein